MEIDELVTITFKEDSVKSTGAKIVITNNSDAIADFGEIYEILIEIEGKWHEINWPNSKENLNKTFGWSTTGRTIEPHSEQQFSEKWKEPYGKLPPGRYLFVKAYFIPSDTMARKEQRFAACPFIIE